MRIKKIFNLILFSFLLSGCNAQYNLVFENDILEESFVVTSKEDNVINGQTFKTEIDNYYNNSNLLVDYKAQPVDMSEEEVAKFYDHYEKTLINQDGLYGIKLYYKYNDYNKYVNSALVFSVFDKIEINDNLLLVSNGKNILENYPDLDKIVVTFKTDKRVLETNSDEVADNVYYWYINRTNYENKTIRIKIDKNIVEKEYDSKVDYGIRLVTTIISIVVGVGLIYILFKIKNSNKK